MMGKDESINLGLSNIWQSWFSFRKGKRQTKELHKFQYALEHNLYQLYQELNAGTFVHGGYKVFEVCENKKRTISVACIRDRVVHRLIYDFLVPLYDPTFIFDAWSCRKGKGLLGAIKRTQDFLTRFPKAFIWKSDIRKYFESVNQQMLLDILERTIKDQNTVKLIKNIIQSYSSFRGNGIGMPIGNLTSQIFSNIYLNEFDQMVKHQLKPKSYLRYGDDFLLIHENKNQLEEMREKAIFFLENYLQLNMNWKNDILLKPTHGLRFLGTMIWPKGRRLNKRNKGRVRSRLNSRNVPSYRGMIRKHEKQREAKKFNWLIIEKVMKLG